MQRLMVLLVGEVSFIDHNLTAFLIAVFFFGKGTC